jgi:hypothetical protein
MNADSIVLYVHIVGALGLFFAMGMEWTGLRQIQGAKTPEVVRTWMGLLKSVSKVGLVSMLATVLTGIYMMIAWFGSEPWLIATLASVVLGTVLAQPVTRPRMVAVGRALATERAPLSESFHVLTNDPLLWISIQTRVALVLGIVFLKVTQPGSTGSVLTIVVATVLGVASAIPALRRQQAQQGPAD